MEIKTVVLKTLTAGFVLMAAQAFAGTDHSQFLKGPFKDGESVTKACLDCHDKQASDLMKTSHWTWKGLTKGHVRGYEKSKVEYGKTNMLNGFCVNVEGGQNQLNRGHCAECHPGYAWHDNSFDHNDKKKVDCLICHAQKGDYAREDHEISEFTDLDVAAKSVGMPTLNNCGFCHFAGGGDDGVKHGTLGKAMLTADKSHDVHMASTAKGGLGFACQNCHTTKEHKIGGASTQMATYNARVSCEDCHNPKDLHKKSPNAAIINAHLKSVACQTCHIPLIAKAKPTLTLWDYSTVGKKIKSEPMEGKATFDDGKGSYVWAKNIVPAYRWFDGTINRYMKGDKIKNLSAPVVMESPFGSISQKEAKIYPFKIYYGNQPADSEFAYLLTFNNFKGLWVHKDWNKALVDGAKGSGLPYSGKHKFVKTVSYIGQTHEVVPKEKALTCGDCHMGGKRMDWKALGYNGDPMSMGGGRFKKGSVAKGIKPENLNFTQTNWVEKHPQVKPANPAPAAGHAGHH